MRRPRFELAVQDPLGIAIARDVGPDRIELCSGLSIGGITPSPALITAAVQAGLATNVLIRPRGGHFEFEAAEFAVMDQDLEFALQAGASGVVIGASKGGHLDRDYVARVVAQTGGRADVVVHRVIDVVADPLADLEWLAQAGVTRVLTSGGAASAGAGLPQLTTYAKHFGQHLEILAGGGVRLEDVPDLARAGVGGIHTSAKHTVVGGESIALGTDEANSSMSYQTNDPALAAAFKAAITALGGDDD